MLKRWGRLLARFVQSPSDQDVLLATLLSLAAEEDALADVFQHVIHAFYNCEEGTPPHSPPSLRGQSRIRYSLPPAGFSESRIHLATPLVNPSCAFGFTYRDS